MRYTHQELMGPEGFLLLRGTSSLGPSTWETYRTDHPGMPDESAISELVLLRKENGERSEKHWQ